MKLINHVLMVALCATLSLSACAKGSESTTPAPAEQTTAAKAAVKVISQAEFKQLIGDYSNPAAGIKFVGKRPAIVDFNADWCGPCRRLAPILEELAREYNGRVDFYSVNVDDNAELAQALGISSIPMLLFCPMQGEMQGVVGLHPKEDLVSAINMVFGLK